MKFELGEIHLVDGVAPLAGAWIEIRAELRTVYTAAVAPLAGAWIEIPVSAALSHQLSGRPPRGGVD